MVKKDTKTLKRKERLRNISFGITTIIYAIISYVLFQISLALLDQFFLSPIWGILCFANDMFAINILLPLLVVIFYGGKTKLLLLKISYLASAFFVLFINICLLFISIFINYIIIFKYGTEEFWMWELVGIISSVIFVVIVTVLMFKLAVWVFSKTNLMDFKETIQKIKGRRPITQKLIAEEIEAYER